MEEIKDLVAQALEQRRVLSKLKVRGHGRVCATRPGRKSVCTPTGACTEAHLPA